MVQTISWVATIATIVAASMTASNLGSRVTGYGFVLFTIGAICWIGVGAMTNQPALLWTNIVLIILDIFGIWRWLRRQSQVEEGGRAAAEASEETPGEALFPVSLLTHGVVRCRQKEVGQCLDAMAGHDSGRLNYVVVSQGGVAGIGEKLRRLPWADVCVEQGELLTSLPEASFSNLPELPRDQWPGR